MMLSSLATPLFEVTFAVLDVETTGGSPETAALTEVGVATFRGGRLLGCYETLVDPSRPMPPFVSELTGITDAMVRGAPPVASVLPTLVEYLGESVLVGHNVGFDLGFLNAALTGCRCPPLGNVAVDTLPLARRLVGDEVPNCTLSTLSSWLELEHRPAHRALADALATADLLHRLLEQAAGYGVTRLGELLELPERLPVRRPVPAS